MKLSLLYESATPQQQEIINNLGLSFIDLSINDRFINLILSLYQITKDMDLCIKFENYISKIDDINIAKWLFKKYQTNDIDNSSKLIELIIQNKKNKSLIGPIVGQLNNKSTDELINLFNQKSQQPPKEISSWIEKQKDKDIAIESINKYKQILSKYPSILRMNPNPEFYKDLNSLNKTITWLEAAIKTDPTHDKKYVDWIYSELNDSRLLLEDVVPNIIGAMINNYLERIDDYILKMKKDTELQGQPPAEVVENTKKQKARLNKEGRTSKEYLLYSMDAGNLKNYYSKINSIKVDEKISPKANIVYKSSNYIVYRLDDIPEIMRISSGTNWCTKNKPQAISYSQNSGGIYLIYDIKYKYHIIQFVGDRSQIKDRSDIELHNSKDIEINDEILSIIKPEDKTENYVTIENFLKEYKSKIKFSNYSKINREIKNINNLDKIISYNIPAIAHKFIKSHNIKNNYDLELIISKNAEYSIDYARTVIKGRFELGEEAISKEAGSCYYACEVLLPLFKIGLIKSPRFELGEEAISKDAYYSSKYAKDIMSLLFVKGLIKSPRFELGEETISKDAYFSLRYADEIIEGKWEPGEEAISKDARCSLGYARDVLMPSFEEGLIKSPRFELGEEAISKDTQHSFDYAHDIIKGKFELGEEAISKGSQHSFDYAKLIKGRFELGEKAISENAGCSFDYARNIIKGRFELGEEAISKDANFSLMYARDIYLPIENQRFELGEKAISKNAGYSADYAHDVLMPLYEKRLIKSPRFELGEKAISKDLIVSKWYAQEILNPSLHYGLIDASLGKKLAAMFPTFGKLMSEYQ